MMEKISYNFKINKENNSLVINYFIKNSSENSLFIQNLLFNTDKYGNIKIDRNKVYILIEQNSIKVTKSIIKVPLGMAVEYPEIPYFSKIGANETYEETIIISTPIIPVHPYIEFNNSDSIISIDKVNFSIAYIFKNEEALNYIPELKCYSLIKLPSNPLNELETVFSDLSVETFTSGIFANNPNSKRKKFIPE